MEESSINFPEIESIFFIFIFSFYIILSRCIRFFFSDCIEDLVRLREKNDFAFRFRGDDMDARIE